ncbi:phage tail tape measure protein [Paraburkholderia tagetis]|uniref:Phage tail tape measure protein n=1 Tax=Paraburkholderia tagetis TaxID=2913261 RepID=A0A9X1RJJ2_9BURK|nr:phage tail tape measure protein [Paraburkholderia tagetis]MCG5072285.1 phage tail tape measure protein [Paraburkholderia tagetis]
MINAYAIGVGATLEDNVTPGLMRIAEWADKANASLLKLSENVRGMSSGSAALARNLEKAARAATAFGDSAGALTRASYVLDTMVASSEALARNMAAARAEANSMHPPRWGGGGGGGSGGSGGGASDVPRGGPLVARRSGGGIVRQDVPGGALVVGSSGERFPSDVIDGEGLITEVPSGGGRPPAAGVSPRSGGNTGTATGVATAGMLFGAYENARLTDQNVKAVATSQVPFDQWQPSIENLRNREMEYASKYAFATGGHIEPFGESILEGSRLLRTLSAAKQKEMMDFAMPYIALESKLKGVSMPEATQAFIGLSHMAGAYDPKQAEPLYESMLQASLTSHASLGQIARAASYALPALHAAGANSSDVMLLVATMMQGGIMNTKSGTWLNAMAMNSLPNTLGSGLFSNKKQNEALQQLGLYKGNQSQFYANGSMDLMKIVSILAEDRRRMDPLKFNAMLKLAFGTQGQRGASFFSEDSTLSNLHALSDLKNFSQAPMDVGQMMRQMSTVALADQTIANANITLMNGSQTLMGPINAALSTMGSFFGATAGFTKNHPVAGGVLDFGMLFGGAVAGLGAWKGAKSAVGFAEKSIVGLTKYLARGAAGLIAEAATAITGEAIGAATVAAIGGEVALGAAILGGIAYVIHHAMDKVTSKMSPDDQTRFYQDVAGGEPLFGSGVTKPAPAQKHDTHVTVKVDSHDVAAHVEKKLVPAKTTGPTGFNPDAAAYSPGMGVYP